MTLRYAGRAIPTRPGQTVLDALLEAGVSIGHSCRAGACQACLVRSTEGPPPSGAQVGLKETLISAGCFLACQCPANLTLTLDAPGAGLEVGARVALVERVPGNVIRLRLELDSALAFRAGQFISLLRNDGLTRSYSIASLPTEPFIELHVRVIPGGQMSEWIARDLAPGDSLRVRGPAGQCFYVAGRPEQPLLLAGTGTGLAPLIGIARDALGQGHVGPIELWHGARDRSGLYAADTLDALAAHANVRIIRCVLEAEADAAFEIGPLDRRLLERHPDLAGWRSFLCGDPGIVARLQRGCFLRGVAMADIHADAFVATPAPVATSS